MKALTVRQPWAWQIIHQRKDIENRTRNIAGNYRGPLAIHAALKADEPALARLPMHAPEWVTARRIFDYGVILGVVDLVDVHTPTPQHGKPTCPSITDAPWTCSAWAEDDTVHLVLDNPRPIPRGQQPRCRGALGLWTPPADIMARLRAVANA
ncbi:hypothetical protein JF780_05665 [Mycobacterium intracellulare]|nr:hypothetical protein [Mycobacterium intracellulare]MCA2324438.1 hypothetical protein [Mycobacterium intracellulare]